MNHPIKGQQAAIPLTMLLPNSREDLYNYLPTEHAFIIKYIPLFFSIYKYNTQGGVKS